MKIELKKLSVNLRMSEETTMFIADLHINGKKVGWCRNEGNGGSTYYNGNTKEDNQIIREAEDYCKTLPKVKYHDMEWEQSLEGVIDEQVENYLKSKEEKKMQKLFQTAVVVGKPNGNSYRYINFKQPLSSVPMTKLVFHVAKIVSDHCRDGVEILNTNFKFENGKVIFV